VAKKQNIIILVTVCLVVAAVVGIRLVRQSNSLEFDSRTLVADKWGAPPDEVLTCEMYINRDKTFGWYWDRPSPQKFAGEIYVKPIFPNVRIGGTHTQQSNTRLFPIRLNEVNKFSLNVSYDYLAPPVGEYNLAYEMFLTDQNRPDASIIPKAEVMIWLHRTFPQPPNTSKGIISDGMADYELFSWEMQDGRMYYSFILNGEPRIRQQHMVDAGKLLSSLDLKPSWYLQGVQLGNEIVRGSGKIQIDSLSINLNDQST
jgi:hypothetical protein